MAVDCSVQPIFDVFRALSTSRCSGVKCSLHQMKVALAKDCSEYGRGCHYSMRCIAVTGTQAVPNSLGFRHHLFEGRPLLTTSATNCGTTYVLR